MPRSATERQTHSSRDLQSASPQGAVGRLTAIDSAELDAIASDWARLGVLFGVKPSQEPVDVELLICDTARVSPDDERLFICSASWIAQYHAFVNGRRLSALALDLDPTTSAVLGALLSLANDAAGGAPELQAARARCRPLTTRQPLFTAVRSMRALSDRTRRNALPLFTAWGLWHDDATLKPSAVRPVGWLLQKVPELRVRSLLGPSVEADLMARALAGEVTAREVARATLTSYAAVHSAADRLVWRGLLVRVRVAQSQVLCPTVVAVNLLGASPSLEAALLPRRGARQESRA